MLQRGRYCVFPREPLGGTKPNGEGGQGGVEIPWLKRGPKKKGVGISGDGSGIVGTVDPAHQERGAVGLLVELTRRQIDAGILLNMPLTAYRSGNEWRVWMRGQVTHCLRPGLEKVVDMWK